MKIDMMLAFLACPGCYGRNWDTEGKKMTCRQCSRAYEIIEGVPVLIQPEALCAQEIGQMQWFDTHYAAFSGETYALENWRLSMVQRILETGFADTVKTYLDIGCGATGYTVIEAAKRKGWISWGADISLEAMVRAKRLSLKQGVEGLTGFVVCSAERLPFKEHVFDYVSAISVLEHLEHDLDTVGRIADILRKNGHCYICVPNAYKRIWFFLWPVYWYLDRRIGHKRHYSIESLSRKMGDNGFQSRDVFYNGHLIKLYQLFLEKLSRVDEKTWWDLEKKDISGCNRGLQLNAVYRRK